MTQGNPWVAAARADAAEAASADSSAAAAPPLPAPSQPLPPDNRSPTLGLRAVPLTGPAAPQPLVTAPRRLLPVREQHEQAVLWVVGAHGGAGETTLAGLGDSWRAAEHAWPALSEGQRASCVLTARTSVRGLYAAQAALTQWAASAAGPSAELLGLVLIADAPGRLPRPLSDLCTVVAGGAPRTWHLPWNEDWRLDRPHEGRPPRPVAHLTGDLATLTDQTN